LVSIGLVFSEEKIFENVYGVQRTTDDGRRRRTPSDGNSSPDPKGNLTIIEYILIIKSLILPKFSISCTVPEKYKKEIKTCCFKFIWKGKADKLYIDEHT
jgi:hypothetical protein